MVSHDTFAVNETQPFVADPGHPSFNSAPSCPLVLSGLSEISFRPYVDPTSSVDMESFIVRHHSLNSNNGAARSVAVRSTLVREEQGLYFKRRLFFQVVPALPTDSTEFPTSRELPRRLL